jgi:hypothetical protein
METKNSLEYAKRVKEIKNNPTLNLETKAMQRAKVKIDQQEALIQQLKNLLESSDQSKELQKLIDKLDKEEEEKVS